MASISRKPSSLPLSVSTTANPNMPTFFEPASNIDRLSKKKKSFSPFDRIKNAFTSRANNNKQIESRGIVPLIVTPTEEPAEKIGNLKTTSYSAENVFNSDIKKSHENSTISVPSNMQRAASNECLKSKEAKIAKLLRSTESLMVESDLGVVSSSLPKNLNDEEKPATLDKEVTDKSCSVERIVSEKSESVQKEESSATFSDLNDVSREQNDLDHRAAHHRKDLKPKGRRPPTVYLQSKTNHDIGTSKTFPSPTHKISSILKLNSSDNLTTTSEVHKEQTTTTETADAGKSSTLQQVKRNKSFAPQLDEMQKIRRKTIAIYQCEKNDEERKEVSGSPEVKVIPPKPQRNTSFKFREELESAKVAEVPKIEKSISVKAAPLHTSTVEKLPSSGEIINGGNFASRRSQFMKVEDATAKDGVEILKSSNKSEDFNKRPQSRSMLGSAPINIPGGFNNLKANHDGQKGSPESIAEVKKATESTSSEDASPIKSDKLSPPKNDKFIVNGQANKIPEPAFKKFYKPVPSSEISENQASIKHVPSKIETPKLEARDVDVAESFESARLKFGQKITKTPQVKSCDEANQQPPPKFAFTRKQNEDKMSPPKSDNQTSNPQANPVLTQFPKKVESKLPLQVAKQIPPEPFKVSTTESSKVPGNSSDISPVKTSMRVKEVDSSVPARISSVKLSKENSSSTSKESEEIDLKQSDKPLTRAAAGINPKIIPSKLNFNPDDWMAKRRE